MVEEGGVLFLWGDVDTPPLAQLIRHDEARSCRNPVRFLKAALELEECGLFLVVHLVKHMHPLLAQVELNLAVGQEGAVAEVTLVCVVLDDLVGEVLLVLLAGVEMVSRAHSALFSSFQI